MPLGRAEGLNPCFSGLGLREVRVSVQTLILALDITNSLMHPRPASRQQAVPYTPSTVRANFSNNSTEKLYGYMDGREIMKVCRKYPPEYMR